MEAGKCLIIVWLKRCPRVSYHQRSSGENSLWEGGMTDHLSSFLSMIIFACAPAWGATPYEYFQVYPVFISTHAPAWGATARSVNVSSSREIFLLTPPRGGRLRGDSIKNTIKKFLLTPPRGGRRSSAICAETAILFLLTPPRGGRHDLVHSCSECFVISTHAPAWGATPDEGHGRGSHPNFYSRPRVGGDAHCAVSVAVVNSISTHAPAWGATWASA